jgi:beta-galactosidase
VRVEDETEGWQLRGKQVLEPGGIWYTQVSGIWQTVWLEEVPQQYIEDLNISTDASKGSITVEPTIAGKGETKKVRVRVFDDGRQISEATGDRAGAEVVVPDAKNWSPDSPTLYQLAVELIDGNNELIDGVVSYTGIRTVGKMRNENGHLRMTLNGKPIFHLGPLDQGWWPDGLLTPPSDAAMLSDIEFLKAAGFNMIRKHIKVEPRRYYYHCDRLGMMVWQDQVSGGKNPPWTRMEKNPRDAEWPVEAHQQYMLEFDRMIESLDFHPSIVVWTPFNEAWGQHKTMDVGAWAVKRDPSRLINIASGGNFWPVGDIADHHEYPHPDFPFDSNRYKDFIQVVGEYGGHGFPTKGHMWQESDAIWGYGDLPKTLVELKNRYRVSCERLAELKGKGIAAGVYTQTTDVETEVNGLMTYDRKVIKIPAEDLKRFHEIVLQEK